MSAREAPLEDAHVALAKHYKTLDGVDSPALVKDVLQMEAWVERVHHLASAGEQGAAEWQTLKLPSPEFYWDRARALSIRFKRYEDAARIYLSCVKHFPEDDYAHHYAAWNFEKARIEPVESRQHYACAVELAQDNPWWNARYAGFLIRSGERQEARNAWRKALQAVDPDGTDTARRPWLADHLHYWVAKSWYEAGHWREARRVLEGVPQDIRKRSVRHFNELETALDESERNERARLIEWLALQQGLAWDAVQAFWENLSQRIHDLPLPVASQGDDHRALLAWSLPDLYLEIEMDEGGTLAWYARDHRLKVSDVGESPSLDITPELLRWLERVAHA
jgi:tetratricopeptide (TPR) repeat protein